MSEDIVEKIFPTNFVAREKLRLTGNTALIRILSFPGSSLRGEKTTSPETENSSGDMSQSRSDKWKAKHEAMLKLQQSISSSPDHSEETEKHVFENRNLVITIKDALKENTENQSIKEADVDERASERSRTNKSKTSESKKDVSRLTTRSMKPVFAL